MKKNKFIYKSIKSIKSIIKYLAPAVIVASIFFIHNIIKQKENKTIKPVTGDSLVNLDYLKHKITLATELIKNGEEQKAIKYYKTLLQYERTFSIIHFNLGKLYTKNEKNQEAVYHFKKAIETNPQNVNAYTFLGVHLRDKMGKYEESTQYLKKAVKLSPKYFDANLQLGKTYHDMGKFKQALKYHKRAVHLSPKSIFPYLNIAYTYNKIGKLETAVTLYKKVIAMDPQCSNAYYNLGYTLKILGRLPEAIKSLDKAIELRPDYLDAHIARSQSKIALQNFDEGWDEYEWRWGLFGIDQHKYKRDMWDGSDIKGKTILLRTEQGLGDTMQFVRLVKNIKEMGAAKVICKVQKPLVKLLSGCDFIDKVIYDIKDAGKCDCHAQLMSLPRILKIQPDAIPAQMPYFKADPTLEKEWAKKLSKDKNFKVGICWHVDPVHEKDKSPWSLRSVNIEQFEPLAKLKNVTFYSLQKLDDYKKLENIPQGMNLQNFGPDFDKKHGSFMDSAAIIKSLDLVITVDTCVAHLAGALNKPVWMLLPYSPDCRWYLKTSKTPWYPTMKLFRQSKPRNWDEPINKIALELGEKIKKNKVS